jgi:aryl-alcohol dehydrogenase-like predicted oxidoreductase
MDAEMSMPRRSLGSSALEVSAVSLGSWRTFERIPRDQGLAVMHAAREAGINFLDDARYNDETGSAPIPTGYSEVIFGELFRAAGWQRQETIVANKLWWEFWPDQNAAQELDASLGRMGLEYVDLIYAERPPEGLGIGTLMGEVAGVIRAGKARAWGVLNWPAPLLEEVGRNAAREGLPLPVAAQLPYSVVQRSPVEDAGMQQALAACGASIVASFVLAGGVLTGKYETNPDAGRAAGTLDSPRVARAAAAARDLVALARDLDTDPATLAIAFALAGPGVSSALTGATHPRQIHSNVGAPDLLTRLDEAALTRLRSIGSVAQE